MLRTPTLRRTAPVALLTAAALLLAGCGGDDGDKKSKDAEESPSASATEAQSANGKCQDYESGDASKSVKVTGDFGKKITATFDTPLETKDLERSVVTEGDGDETKPGDEVDTLVGAYIGSDGKELGSQALPLTVADESNIAAFSAGVECVPLGSRVVVVVPAAQMYGPSGNPQVGIKGDDSIVIVTDVIKKKAQLTPKAWTNAPKVTFAKDGKPTLKLTGSEPKDLVLKVLREGEGEVVGKGDSVTLDYQGTSWKDKKIFDQSYGKTPATFKTNEVVQGFGAALVGQKVGSRLVVSIPPEYAYGEAGSGSELAGQTLVFVIEIKATEAG